MGRVLRQELERAQRAERWEIKVAHLCQFATARTSQRGARCSQCQRHPQVEDNRFEVVRETHKIVAHALPASRGRDRVREYHWEQLRDRAAQGAQVLKAGRTRLAGTGNAEGCKKAVGLKLRRAGQESWQWRGSWARR
jgi:hypothetical protein